MKRARINDSEFDSLLNSPARHSDVNLVEPPIECPVCYEEIMRFKSKENSFLVRLSKKLLRFICNKTNLYIEKIVKGAIHFFDSELTGTTIDGENYGMWKDLQQNHYSL